MYAAVNEAARLIGPLGAAIASGITKSIDIALSAMIEARRDKAIEQLAHALRMEYPHESEEYVYHMATRLYAESK